MDHLLCRKIFVYGPLIFGYITGAIVVLVGCCVTSPGKVVRITFPFIRRKGNNTVMFGFILTEWHITGVLWGVYCIISQIISTFCANILIIHKNNNNPFSATSIVLFCANNGTTVQSNDIESLELNGEVTCFAINHNIAGAMGQATGALAFGWVMASIITWIALNVNYRIIQGIKNYELRLCYQFFQSLVPVIFFNTCVNIHVIFGEQWYFNPSPENWLIFTIIYVVLMLLLTLNTDIRKEPKSLEECCRETMKMKTHIIKNYAVKSSLIEIAKHKYMELLAEEMESQFNENTMQRIVEIAFDKITTGIKNKYILQKHMPTKQHTPTEQEDTPTEPEDTPTEQEDMPTEQENPSTEQDGIPLVVIHCTSV